MTNEPAIHWELLDFAALDAARLHAIFKARADVFVVEQNIVYSDPDKLDHKSHHLVGWGAPNVVAAYLRMIPPGAKYDETGFGRILTTAPYRGTGLGRKLMRLGIEHAGKLYPGQGARMSAQQYLEKFYQEFGFATASEPYEEEGIMHIEMLLAGNK